MLLLNRHESLHVFIKKMRNYLFLKKSSFFKSDIRGIRISVEDEELIVGNRTKGVRYGVVFPESGCSWINQEFETLPTRPQDQFLVKEEDIKDLEKRFILIGKENL